MITEHDPEKWKPVFGKDHAPMINLAYPAQASRGAPLSLPLSPTTQFRPADFAI